MSLNMDEFENILKKKQEQYESILNAEETTINNYDDARKVFLKI